MKPTRTLVGAAALASALGLALTGTASAADSVIVHGPDTAKEATQDAGAINWPKNDYMVCGTAYEGPYQEFGPSAGSAAIEGVTVTGTLIPIIGGTTTMTAVSAADGTWCFQGDAAMAAAVTFGGRVEITADPITIPGVGTLDADGNGGSTRDIWAADFDAHKYPAGATIPLSASWFSLAYS